MLVNIAILQ